jgi:DNA mismatch repair protein MutS2
LALEKQHLLEEQRKVGLWELSLRQKEAELKSGSIGNLRRLLDESRKTLENLVREVKEGDASREKTLEVKDFLQELDRAIDRETEGLRAEKAELSRQEKSVTGGVAAPANTEIHPGLAVLAGDGRLRGKVRRPAKKGYWVVEIGSVAMTFPETELVAENPPQNAAGTAPASVDYSLPENSVPLELNVRGMRLSDAIDALQRHIDSALVLGLKEFSVIHGKGDGVLQRGVHDYLKGQSVVEDFHFSHPDFGGFGRTEVALRLIAAGR